MAMHGYAQKNVIIKGRVLDETGTGLPGVNLSLQESSLRATTNDKGAFGITVPDAQTAVLVVGYVGYKTQSVAVAGRQNLTIQLVVDASSLNEVVVTALGITRQSKSLGYSRQGVNVEEMTEARDPNITNMLAGKVAGLQLTTSGQPTGSSRVILRGVTSLTGNNQPLWVVDGVPIDNSDGQQGNLDYGNAAGDLNPDDIANIEVLKGPNAAALYGSKAANGAILVTTKKGKNNGKLGFSVSSNLMVSSVQEFLGVQNVYGEGNGGRFVQSINSIIPGLGAIRMGTNNRSFGFPMLGQPYATFSGQPTTYSPRPNNIKDLYQTAVSATQNVAFSKADENSSIRLSYTFNNGNDVIEKQNLRNKHSFSLNTDKRFTKWLKIDSRIQYVNDRVENRTYRNMDVNSPMNAYLNMLRSLDISQLTPWKDANGDAFIVPGAAGTYENPYWAINENSNMDKKDRIIGGITATADLLPGLKFRGQIAADLAFGKGYTFLQKGSVQNKTGAYSVFTSNNQVWNTEGLLMYTKKISKFTVSGNLGGNLRSMDNLYTNASTRTLAVHDMKNISNTLSNPLIRENPLQSKINSIYGNANIGYDNYAYLEITGRNDWSSTLPKANRSFFYPSVNGSFIFSEFFKLDKSVISFGKIRASVARVGNDTSPYNLLSAFNYGGNFNGNTYVIFDNLLKNENLKPERTTSTEAGLEMAFFNNRLRFEGTVYKSSTINQIFVSEVPRETGYNNKLVNAGQVDNKGIELTISGTPISSRNFTWDINTNFSLNRNKVVSLAPGVNTLRLGSWFEMSSNAEVGMPVGVIRGNDAYKDAQGNSIIRSDSGIPYAEKNVLFGSFLPNWLASFGSSFKYKNFDFSFLLNARWGGQIYSVTSHKSNSNGTSLQSLAYRDEYIFSNLILGESGNEIKGTTQLGNLPYPDAQRVKGARYEGYYPKLDSKGQIMYDANGRMIAGDPNTQYILPQNYWQGQDNNMRFNLYDATFLKLNQVILGYSVPKKWLQKQTSVFQSARISVVGRNVWTIYKKTPKGIDPESSSSSGNGQGIEMGGSLPYSTYGVDFKLSF